MAKRRITLTSQEMNEINARTETLESQLKKSNARVDELENGLTVIKKLTEKKTKPKSLASFIEQVTELVDKALNPPVIAKLLAAEAAKAAAALEEVGEEA